MLFDSAKELIGLFGKKVALGSEAADEPFVLGNVRDAFITRWLTDYAGHSHTGMGFAPSPQAIAFEAAENPKTDDQLSLKIFGERE